MFNLRYSFIFFTFLGIFLNAQVKLVNKKGTELEVDPSKWTQTANDIFNKNTGNVGIGISTPQDKLHINSTTPLTKIRLTNFISGTSSTNGLEIFLASDEAQIINKQTGDLFLSTNGNTNQLKLDQNGNIGINISATSAKLHTNGTIRFEGLGTNTTNTNLLTTNTTGDVTTRTLSSLLNTSWSLAGNTTTNPVIDFIGTTDVQDLVFKTQNTEKMRLFSQNTHPAFGLGRSTLTGINGGASTFSGPTLFLGTAGNFSSSTGFDFIIDDDNTSTNTQFTFKANGDGAVGTLELMQINETGNVGIGLTSGTASAKLHTNGTLRFEGLGTNTSNTNILTTNASGDVTTRSISSIITATTPAAITSSGTVANINNTTANWNANQLQGNNIATTAPTNRQLLTWDSTTSTWKPDGYTVTTVAATTYTLSEADHGKILDFTSASAITLTIPTALTTGFQVSITQANTGVITFVGSGGMVVNNRWSATKTAGRWAKAGVEIRATNSAVLSGDVL